MAEDIKKNQNQPTQAQGTQTPRQDRETPSKEAQTYQSPEVKRVDNLANNNEVQAKSDRDAHKFNQAQIKEMEEKGLDTTPEAAKLSWAESKERVAQERKAEGRFSEIGQGGGEEMAKKVAGPETRVVDQTNQREQQGFSASDPVVVYGFTTREAGDTAFKGKSLNEAGGTLMTKFIEGLSSSEKEAYERNPRAAMSGFRSWLDSRSDTQLEDLLFED